MNQEQVLIHKKEKLYFIFAVVISIFTYATLILSIIGIFFLGFGILFPLFLSALMNAHIRTNGVRLSAGQFPRVFEEIQELCVKMDIPVVPDVYVVESSGILNAFATRFFGRNMVVLYSDVFDLINSGGDKELSFIISHELAHVKRNHITRQLLILPAMWVPFLGEAYSRACEYTCDRMAAYFTGDADRAANGLVILAIGKSLYRQVNRPEYLYQASQERGFFAWLAEMISTHPPLPKRINEVEVFMEGSSERVFKTPSKTLWLVSCAGILIFITAMLGYSFSTSLKGDGFKELMATFDAISSDEGTELIKAVADEDLKKVKKQLNEGADPNVQDSDGWTPLFWAVQGNDPKMIKMLLDGGADPNLRNIDDQTALIQAIYNGNKEFIKVLVEAGADSNLKDSSGWTPLMYAATSDDIEVIKTLLEAGADPKTEDAEKMTAFMHAKKGGYKENAKLLQQAMKGKP